MKPLKRTIESPDFIKLIISLSVLADDEKYLFGLSGFVKLSTGLNIPRDLIISALSIFVTVAVSPANSVLGRCFQYAKLSTKTPKIHFEINTNMPLVELFNILLTKS